MTSTASVQSSTNLHSSSMVESIPASRSNSDVSEYMESYLNADNRRVFRCKICSKTLTRGYSLKIHLDIHFGIKRYPCEECGQRFTSRQYLKEHTFIHSGEKPYVCPIAGCNRTFRQRGKMCLHRRKVHRIILKTRSGQVLNSTPKSDVSSNETVKVENGNCINELHQADSSQQRQEESTETEMTGQLVSSSQSRIMTQSDFHASLANDNQPASVDFPMLDALMESSSVIHMLGSRILPMPSTLILTSEDRYAGVTSWKNGHY